MLPANAAHEKGSSRLNLSAYTTINSGVFLRDDKFDVLSLNMANYSSAGFFDRSYKNAFVFGIDRTVTNLGAISSSLTNNIYRAEIDVLFFTNTFLQTGNTLSSTVSFSLTKTFTVSFGGFNTYTMSGAPGTETDIDAYNFENSYETMANITGVRIYNSYTSTTALSTTNIPANLYIELQCDAERYYALPNLGVPAFSSNSDLQAQYITGTSTGNEIEVKWKRIPGAEAYDLEWLWLDEYTYGAGSTPPANAYWTAVPELNFRNNATRIRTDQNVYRISNIYESGHVFFRVRGVGTCATPAGLVSSGNPALSDCYTDWTWPDTTAIDPQPANYTTAGVNGSSVPWYVDLRSSAHEDDKNWTYTGAYAENGKKKEVVNYFDGAQYSRQTVTRNNTDNVAIVGETYYDFIGRPAISALPTPVADATIKFYQQSLSGGGTAFNFKNGTNTAYDKLVFSVASSTGACSTPAAGFNNTYGTGKYYSSNNPFQSLNYNNGYTPDAETYPFTQTEYMPDNTGRITRQSGTGKALQIQATGAMHDTRYLYGSVNQDELDRLFGSEAGSANHYTKKTSIDPNGVVTLSYMNQEGKVVATAVSGSAPPNEDALLSSMGATLSAATQMETDLLNKVNQGDYDTPNDANLLQGDALIFSESIALASAQTYYFNYSLVNTSNSYTACSGICFDCVYDLEFDIKDNCGNRPAGFTPISVTAGTVSGTYPTLSSTIPPVGIDSTGGNNPVSFSFQQIASSGTNLAVSLNAGMYTISKKLSVNKKALGYYLDSYIRNCVKSSAAYASDEATNVNVAGCDMSCAQCAANLGGLSVFTTSLMAQNSAISYTEALAIYNAAVKTCYEPCQQDDNCSAMIEIMLTDMAPSGQYAEFSGAGTAMDTTSYPLSVFNTNSRLQRRGTASSAPWRNPENFENTAQNFYVDDNGAQSKVIVTQLSAGVYDPELLTGASVALVSGTTDQYYADPQSLKHAGDFVSNFKSSWSKSLLKYHPEYPYVLWCLQNKTQTVSPVSVSYNNYNSSGTVISTSVALINNSLGFDSLYAAIEDIDDIASASYGVVFNPLANDPYWSTTGMYYVSSTSGNPSGVTLPNTAQQTDNTGIVPQRQSTSSGSPSDFTGVTNMHFNQRTNKTANDRFLNYKGTGYSIIQIAAYLATPLAQQPNQPMSTQIAALLNTSGPCTSIYYPSGAPTGGAFDYNYILNIKKPCSGSTDDSYKRKAWENFKSLYASLKQEMQVEAVQSYVMNSSNRGCNACIGEANFDVNSVRYTTYSNQMIAQIIGSYNPTIPGGLVGIIGLLGNILSVTERDWYKYPTTYTLNAEQECGMNTKDLYKNKVKRYSAYTSADVDQSSLTANTGAGIYQQTGLCPNAYDLQGFLNGMVQVDGFFNTSLDLSANVPSFSQNLYQAIRPTVPSPFVDAVYSFISSTNPDLIANIAIGTPNSNLKLTMPASVVSPIPSGILNWANYQGAATYTLSQFSNLTPGPGNTFSVIATILASNMSGPPSSYTVAMTGDAYGIVLTGCSFAPPCKANGTGNAVNALINTFAGNAAFPAPYTSSYQTGYLLTPTITPYSYVFTNSFKPLLETPGNSNNNWQWTYSAGDIVVSDGTTTNKRLKISFTVPGSPNMACFQTFQNFRPDPQSNNGGFLIDGIISNVASISSCPSGSTALTATASMGTYNGSSWVYSPLNIGGCSFQLSTCSTQPHLVKADLQQFVLTSGSGFTTAVTSASKDISNNLYFTPLLRSFLNSGVNSSSSGPLQNYFWWYRDAVNTTTAQITGWLCVTNSSTAPSSAPTDGCKITIKRKNSGTIAVATLLANIGSTFRLASAPLTSGSAYDFKLAPGGSATTNDTLLVNTTCFPLRSCDTPTCTTSAGIVIQNFKVPGATSFTVTNLTQATNLTVSSYGPGSTVSTTLNHNNAIVVDTRSVNITATMPEILCSSGTCTFVSTSGNAGLYDTETLPDAPFNFYTQSLTFNNCETCTSGTCCSASTRTVEYSQLFSVGTTGSYNISFDVVSLPDNLSCGVNSMAGGNIVNQYISVYVDNTLYAGPTGINQYVRHTLGATAGLSSGTHTLTLRFYCLSLRNIYRIFPITMSSTSAMALPCVNNNNTWPTDTMPTTDYVEPCAEFLQDLADNSSDEKYDANLDSLKNAFSHKYITKCLGRAVETMSMKYSLADYHYTLYYYDQAGNLSRTVPPEGVKLIDLNASYSGGGTNRQAIKDDRANYGGSGYTKKIYTKHNYLTTYKYNSLNQLTKSETPDAGISKFYYDNLGRLVASQNAEQKYQSTSAASTNQMFSYTKYDALGRVSMVGRLGTYDLDTYPVTFPQTVKDVLSDANYPFNLSIYSGSHREVTQTYYGDGAGSNAISIGSAFSTGSQNNIRNRVASVTLEDVYDGVDNTYNHATHYSYDIHGNVNELVQDNTALADYALTQQRFKNIQYAYDLISGNVNSVVYQNNKPDMMMHKYLYDANNRVTNVYTSRDALLWDQDAKYYYYLHGPMAREELGEYKVQGSDYAYTLHGWMKGVNSEGLVAANDMGKDGYSTLTGSSTSYNLNRYSARDGFGFGLSYYTDFTGTTGSDYKPLNGADATTSTYFLATLDPGKTTAAPYLFNGNISHLSAAYLNPDPTPISLNNIDNAVTVNQYTPYSFLKLYKYDQLNRITSTAALAEAVDGTNSWDYTKSGNIASEYAENFRYDENGNILKTGRTVAAGQFDDLAYYYYDQSGTAFNPVTTAPSNPPTNRLAYVTDAGGASILSDDIKSQSSNNYNYDKNGNLTVDASGNISGIQWTNYGKIKSITKSNFPTQPNLEFTYDAGGNRVSKKEILSSTHAIVTYYVRDAQGNEIATYEQDITGSSSLTKVLTLKELGVYGSKRLGLRNCNTMTGYILSGTNQTNTAIPVEPEHGRTLGYKAYELSNHLGNVLTVVSDRKLVVDGNVDNTADYFVPNILSTTDYFAFGSPMPGRQFNNGNYRYGFNGKENDNDIKGIGNSLDFGARLYDSRLGKWLSVDPLASSYTSYSPYNFAVNNPIIFIDPDGMRVKYHREDGVSRKEFRQFKRDIRSMRRNSESFNTMYKDLNKSEKTYVFNARNSGGGENTHNDKETIINIGLKSNFGDANQHHSVIGNIAHETGHAWLAEHGQGTQFPSYPTIGLFTDKTEAVQKHDNYIDKVTEAKNSSEIQAMHIENIVRTELNGSGASAFKGIGLNGTYQGGFGIQLTKSSDGLLRKQTTLINLDVLKAPHNAAYYQNTKKFNINSEFNIKPK